MCGPHLKNILLICTLLLLGRSLRGEEDAGSQERIFPHSHGMEKFYKLAKSFEPVTDKVVKHKYYIMYGRFLVPKAEAYKREKKVLKVRGRQVDDGRD